MGSRQKINHHKTTTGQNSAHQIIEGIITTRNGCQRGQGKPKLKKYDNTLTNIGIGLQREILIRQLRGWEHKPVGFHQPRLNSEELQRAPEKSVGVGFDREQKYVSECLARCNHTHMEHRNRIAHIRV